MRKTSVLVLFLLAALAAAGPASIIVGLPRAGNVLCKGQTYPIRWTSSGVRGLVTIQLIHSSGVATLLAEDISNSGKFDYTVSNTISNGSYMIRVSSSDGRVRGESGSFRIDSCLATGLTQVRAEIARLITIAPMLDYEVRWVGGYSQIKWTTTGRMPDLVNITLHQPGCGDAGTFLATANPYAHEKWVRFPTTLADQYYSIRVGLFGSDLFGCSARIHLRRDLFVTEPNSRTVWYPGESVYVRWRRERPFLTGLITMYLLGPAVGGSGHGFLVDHVPEAAGQVRVTVPDYLSPGTLTVLLCYDGGGGRGGGPESDTFQVGRR